MRSQGLVQVRTLAAELSTYWSLFRALSGSLSKTPLQLSKREEMKERMRVSETESDRYCRSLEMFFKWKKDVLMMDLMWD